MKVNFAQLFMLLSFGLTTKAMAGDYEASVTTGLVVTSTNGGVTQPSALPGPVHAGFGGGSGTGSITGVLTTTFTWKPAYANEPPPDSVIISETCSVEAHATVMGATQPAGVDAQNGLESEPRFQVSPIPNKDHPIGFTTTGTCQGTRSQVYSGGPTITVRTSPQVSVPNVNSAYNGSLDYSVRLTQVSIGVSGAKDLGSGTLACLVGQRLSCRLVADGYAFQDYAWTASGECFKGTDFDSSYSYRRYVFLSPADMALAQLDIVYEGDASSEITSSATALLNGRPIGAVRASKQITVRAPDCSPLSPVFGRTTDIHPTSTDCGYVSAGNPGVSPGCRVDATVAKHPFLDPNGAATFNFTQLLTVLYTTFLFSGEQSTRNYAGQNWLDNSFPYYPGAWKQAGQTHTFNDSPCIGYVSATGRAVANASFSVFVVYSPPYNGIGSEVVPLRRMDWSWVDDATRTDALHDFVGTISPSLVKTGHDDRPLWQLCWEQKANNKAAGGSGW